MESLGYNTQRDNDDFGGRVSGHVQCFSTCAWMFMAYYDAGVDAGDDRGLRAYVDDVESRVGVPRAGAGTAEWVIARDKAIRQAVEAGMRSMYFWRVHAHAIEVRLHRAGVSGTCVYREGMRLAVLDKALARGPVILATNKLGGLRGGHVILLLGKQGQDGYIVHDPYGDARSGYRNHDGNRVLYGRDLLTTHATDKGRVRRCLYWTRNT